MCLRLYFFYLFICLNQREMADIHEDEEEQSEFDEALKREEALNLENMGKDSVQDAASTVVKTIAVSYTHLTLPTILRV